ncbi:MAG TPA: ABC transporter ATP-binding protein [Pirellulaceae bacterium]|nr:ABC transporter ATP-binding protein [Pirellulaceae bacterium]
MSEPVIQLLNVRKSFGKHPVLKGMNLTIERGQIFALLGRNGAGKTTAIRLLLGLINRDGGSIAVLGRDPQQEPLGVRAAVGFLAEDQQMFGWMTIAELLGFMAPFYSTWDRTLADRFVKEFELPRGQRIKNLSKGQNVRLGLVLALAHRPELVILDDPALGLDPIMRKEFNRDLIAHLQGEGASVLYSSHLLYEVEPIADSVAILHEGVIIKQSATEALRSDVKQIVFSAEDYAEQSSMLKSLDVLRQRAEVAVTIENSADTIERLIAAGVRHRVIDLNLDDIFAAYVIGKPDRPAQSTPSSSLAVPA